MARSRDRDAGADPRDLEVLDPITGEAVPRDQPARVDEGPRERGRRRRRLALVLALASVVCAGAAGWFGLTIWSIRSTEQVWAEAMALDGARAEADREVRERLASVGNPENDAAAREAIRSVGEETARRLLPLEERLRDQRIADDRISDLRDLMLEALRFRRFQLSAERGLLGDTPLQKAEAALDLQLERFGLERSAPPSVELASVAPALAALGNFADEETGTLLVVSTFGAGTAGGRELLVIDLDASVIRRRVLPAAPQGILAADELVLVFDGRATTAYPLDVHAAPAWRRDIALGVAGRPGTGVAMWVWAPGDAAGIVPIGLDGEDGPTVAFPQTAPGRAERWHLLADTDAGLLVGDPTSARLQVVDRGTGRVVRTIDAAGRFVGASRGFVAKQLPGRPMLELHRLADGSTIEVPLPRTDAGPIVQERKADAIAFAAGPVAGNIASVLYLRLAGASWELDAVGGPRATVRPGTLVFAPSDEHLFWVTTTGRLGVASDHRGPGQLRVPVDDVQQLFAVPNGR